MSPKPTTSKIERSQLGRYRDVVSFVLKHLDADVIKAGLIFPDLGDLRDAVAQTGKPETFAADLEDLGPTFVKLGQVLAGRVDLLPEPYINALDRLHGHVDPFPYEEFRALFAEETGLTVEEAFAEIDPEPLGAASLGQVYRAVLPDGTPVAVKAQRPGIRQLLLSDMRIFRMVASVLESATDFGERFGIEEMVSSFRESIIRELDYRLEARNLETLARIVADQDLVVPRPYDELSTSRILVMDYVEGQTISDLDAPPFDRDRGRELAEELTVAYLRQILEEGFLHADPHPGNIIITPDHRLAVIDLGMVAYVGQRRREDLVKLLLAVVGNRGEEAADICLSMGTRLEGASASAAVHALSEAVTRFQHNSTEHIRVDRLLLELSRISAAKGYRPPAELMMLGKALMHLGAVGKFLDPEFDPGEVVSRHGRRLVQKRLTSSFSLEHTMRSMLETNTLIQRAPQRINNILETLSRNELEFKVNAFDDSLMTRSFQKVANRITMGLVMASLILAGALIMRIESPYTLFGYPAMAMVLFGLAVLGGAILIVTVLLQDLWRDRH